MADKRVNYELRAEDSFSGAFDKLKGRITDTQGHFERMKGVVAGMFAGASLAGMAAMIKSVVDAGDEAFKMAQKVGIGVEAWQQLVYVAKLSNVEQEALAKGIKGLSTNVLEAADGGEKAQDMFRRMGVSVRDVNGAIKPTQQILLDVAQRFSTMPDGIQKTAIATQFFRKAGLDLIPMLNQGRAGMEALMQEAVRLGLVMDERTAASAEALNDNLTRLSAATRGMIVQGVAPLIPFMERMSESMVKARTSGDGLANGSKILETGLKLVGSVAIVLKGTFEAIGQLIGGIAAAWIAWVSLKPGDSMSILKQTFADVATIADRNKALLSDLWNGTAEGAKKATVATKGLGDSTVNAAKASNELNDVLNRIFQKSSGFSQDFTKTSVILMEAMVRGRISVEQYHAAFAAFMAQQPAVIEFFKDIADAEEKLRNIDEQTQQEADDITTRLLERGHQRATALQDEVNQQRIELDVMGKTNVEREIAILDMQKEIATRGLIDDKQRSNIEGRYEELKLIARARGDRQAELDMWGQLSDRAGQFFSDLVMHGKSAFDSLKNMVKQLLAEMIALFAKRWILQLAANATGSSTLSSAAGSLGQGSMAGNALSLFGSASGLSGAYAGFLSAGSEAAMGASFVGPSATLANGSVGLGASLGEGYAELMSVLAEIPIYGWIAMAVIAVAAWLGGRHKGGPKVGGSFFTGGMVPDTDNGRFFTPNQGDEALSTSANAFITGGNALFRRLGGRGTNLFGQQGTEHLFDVGFGFDHDPNGTAQSRVSSLLTDARTGQVLYNARDMNMDDKEVPAALALEMKRQMLVALQHADLGSDINKLLGTAGDVAHMSAEEIDALLTKAVEMKSVLDALKNVNFNDSLNIESLQAFALEGETLSQTFTRITGQIAQFDAAFMTDAQKTAFAQKQVTDVFKELGIAVPKSKEEFYDLVHSLDLSTESGRAMFTALMGVAPAFLEVSNAADAASEALAANLEAFDKFMDRLHPGYAAGRSAASLDSSIDQFFGTSAGAQFSGMSHQDFLEFIRTMDPEQFREMFAGWDDSTQKLILTILGLDGSLQENTSATQQQTVAMNPAYTADPGSIFTAIMGGFEQRFGGVIGAGSDLMSQMGLRSTLSQGEVDRLVSRKGALEQAYGGSVDRVAEYQAVLKAIDAFKEQLAGLGGDMARLTVLTAQYGQATAEQIFNLEKWYDAQKALIGTNQDALLALETIFQDKRAAILEQGNAQAAAAMESARSQLGQFIDSLFTNQQLSPLTLVEQAAVARKQYEDTLALAQGGDLDAIRNLQGVASTFLGIDRQLLGSSPLYNADFESLVNDLAGVAQVPGFEERMSAAIPDGKFASAADIERLEARLAEVSTQLSDGIAVDDEDSKELLREIRDALAKSTRSGGLVNA